MVKPLSKSMGVSEYEPRVSPVIKTLVLICGGCFNSCSSPARACKEQKQNATAEVDYMALESQSHQMKTH
ncbi:hypothetical protein C5167_040458 [Papaver somniferum]|uniref:Uncharacterized protein n=1 Tax=Papaver somniferum TaxID=3469 RepID=A0A4Y7III5_PAPSO|nr:hypothetical protein C5167_040458 [Papaver somniferum]